MHHCVRLARCKSYEMPVFGFQRIFNYLPRHSPFDWLRILLDSKMHFRRATIAVFTENLKVTLNNSICIPMDDDWLWTLCRNLQSRCTGTGIKLCRLTWSCLSGNVIVSVCLPSTVISLRFHLSSTELSHTWSSQLEDSKYNSAVNCFDNFVCNQLKMLKLVLPKRLLTFTGFLGVISQKRQND
jgi:hypothetical protein